MVQVNTLGTCEMVGYLFYGTILLIYIMKIVNLLHKITCKHILTSFSTMNLKLAAQVLISTVSDALSNFASPDAAEAAEFCSLRDTFLTL